MKCEYKNLTKTSLVAGFILAISVLLLIPVDTFAYYSDTYTPPNPGQINDPRGRAPYVVTKGSDNISTSEATLNGFVDSSYLYTTVWFEWGANGILNNSTQYHYGTDASNYARKITGLTPNTVYSYRAAGRNSQGTAYGDILSFRTVVGVPNAIYYYPSNNQANLSAITNPATSVAATSAQINALVINSENSSSNSWFEWGTTGALGNKTTSVSTGILPAIRHASTMYGLAPNTTYYYRAVAENSAFRNIGATLSFTTRSAISAVSRTTNTTNNSSTSNTTTLVKEITPARTVETITTQDEIVPYLASNVLGGGSFLPRNILGWLLIIVLILALILLGKYLRADMARSTKHA